MNDNIFDNVISKEFKNLYNNAIDSLLSINGLTVPCLLRYSGANNTVYCNNCIYDTISGLSSNKYNSTGPNPFADGSVCPVCVGMGTTISASSAETLYLACVFDSKYWLNWSSKSVNIPDNMVQIICKNELLPKIRNATEITIDTEIAKYGNYIYERASDPEPAGLGSHKYIISMWKRK
jgi:hypothetical protein